MTTIEYTQGSELPNVEVTWKDSDQVLIPFATQAHTFSFRVASTPVFTKGVLGGSQTGITAADTAPNVTIAFAVADFDSMAPGEYAGQLWARRSSDSKDRQPLPFTFRLKPAIS